MGKSYVSCFLDSRCRIVPSLCRIQKKNDKCSNTDIDENDQMSNSGHIIFCDFSYVCDRSELHTMHERKYFFINRIYDDRTKTRKTSHVNQIVTRRAASTLLDSIHFSIPEKI